MSRSASAAPRSPATVLKRANISVFLPTSLKMLARVYWVMSLVTVKVPKAPEPLACMRRSGITSRTKLASFSFSQVACAKSGPRGPAVRLSRLVVTGVPALAVRCVTAHLDHFFESVMVFLSISSLRGNADDVSNRQPIYQIDCCYTTNRQYIYSANLFFLNFSMLTGQSAIVGQSLPTHYTTSTITRLPH